ncbi:MAG TPA: hypothetical protein VFB74_29735 [Kribbellaceae bacterium]|nr:hypothetical protein [Kribbellaceae bacterium]
MTGQRDRQAGRVGREVEVVAPGGPVFRFRLGDDDTAVVLLEGQPVVGIDAGGPGRWRDGEVWERFGGGTVTDRYVVVLGMSAERFTGLAPHLGLPAGWFGRFKGGPGELRDISLTGGEWELRQRRRPRPGPGVRPRAGTGLRGDPHGPVRPTGHRHRRQRPGGRPGRHTGRAASPALARRGAVPGPRREGRVVSRDRRGDRSTCRRCGRPIARDPGIGLWRHTGPDPRVSCRPADGGLGAATPTDPG